MKYATIEYKGTEMVCAVFAEKKAVLPLMAAEGKDMQYLIEHYDVLRAECEREAAVCRGEDLLSLDDPQFRLLSPIPFPRRNIVCLGKNYLEHVKEIGGITGGPKDTAPDWPIYFTKAAFPCLEPGGTILRHETVTKYIDYEAELTVVMGKRGTYIPEEEALSHVFGYTIGNDISARDVQNRHVNWFKGKSLTTHCPVGPWIVTADEIPDPQNLTVQSYVAGELRQNGNTGDMIRSVAEIIHELSQGYELFPGDMIMTGTPKGVGMGFDPPRYLMPGNEVKCVISQIGELTNYLEK